MAKKVTTNFQPEYKLWKACAKEDMRSVLEYVHFKDGYAYASDGYVLVRVPLSVCTTLDDEQIELLNGFAIHAPLLKMLVGFEKIQVGHIASTVNGVEKILAQIVATSGDNIVSVTLSDNLAVTPPDFEKVMSFNGEREPVSNIGLYGDRVKIIADAMGANRLELKFRSSKDGVLISPANDESDVIGMIMPFMLDE